MQHNALITSATKSRHDQIYTFQMVHLPMDKPSRNGKMTKQEIKPKWSLEWKTPQRCLKTGSM